MPYCTCCLSRHFPAAAVIMHYTVPVITQMNYTNLLITRLITLLLSCSAWYLFLNIPLILVAYVLVCFATSRYLWLSLRFANITVAFSGISVIAKNRSEVHTLELKCTPSKVAV